MQLQHLRSGRLSGGSTGIGRPDDKTGQIEGKKKKNWAKTFLTKIQIKQSPTFILYRESVTNLSLIKVTDFYAWVYLLDTQKMKQQQENQCHAQYK